MYQLTRRSSQSARQQIINEYKPIKHPLKQCVQQLTEIMAIGTQCRLKCFFISCDVLIFIIQCTGIVSFKLYAGVKLLEV